MAPGDPETLPALRPVRLVMFPGKQPGCLRTELNAGPGEAAGQCHPATDRRADNAVLSTDIPEPVRRCNTLRTCDERFPGNAGNGSGSAHYYVGPTEPILSEPNLYLVASPQAMMNMSATSTKAHYGYSICRCPKSLGPSGKAYLRCLSQFMAHTFPLISGARWTVKSTAHPNSHPQRECRWFVPKRWLK